MGARISGIAGLKDLCSLPFQRNVVANLSMSGFGHSDGKTKKKCAKQKPCSRAYYSRTLWNQAKVMGSVKARAKALALTIWTVTHPHAKSETHCHAAI